VTVNVAAAPEAEAGGRSVLHLTAPARLGGLERVVTELTSGFRRRGEVHRVVAVLEREDREHPFVLGLRQRGVPVDVLVLPAHAYARERRAVLRVCAQERPAILHTHGYRSDLLHYGTARRIGARVVSTLHGLGGADQPLRGRLYEYLQVRRLRRFDGVVAVSQVIAGRLGRSGVRPDRVHVIPNAIGAITLRDRTDARQCLGAPAGRLVGFVGRLSHEKGADVFLEAVARLPDGVGAIVIGEGPERRALEVQADTLGLGERIRFAGGVPEAGALLSAFDAVVLSSRTEGTPMILLEAMAAGVPVVATRVGGVPDLLDERSGWLVSAEEPEGLASAIGALLADAPEARRRAAAARDRVDRDYGVERWLDRYEAVYADTTRAVLR